MSRARLLVAAILALFSSAAAQAQSNSSGSERLHYDRGILEFDTGVVPFAERRARAQREMTDFEFGQFNLAVHHLQNPYSFQRLLAARVLRILQYEGARRTLEEVINNRFDCVDVRVECCRAMACVADERTVDFLLEAADDPRIAGPILVNLAALLGTEVPLEYQHKAPPVFVPPIPCFGRALPIVQNAEGLQTVVNPFSFNFLAEDTKSFYVQWQQRIREHWRQVKDRPDHGFQAQQTLSVLKWDDGRLGYYNHFVTWQPAFQDSPNAAWLSHEDEVNRRSTELLEEKYSRNGMRLYPGVSSDGLPDKEYQGRYTPMLKLPKNVVELRRAWLRAFGTPEQERDGLEYGARILSKADAEVVSQAERCLLDPLCLERFEALQILNLYHSRTAIATLKQVTDNHFEAVDLRTEACRVLANIPDPVVIPTLLKAAKDPRVAGVALTSLSGILQVPPRKEYVNGDRVTFVHPLPRYGHVHSWQAELTSRVRIGLDAESLQDGTQEFYRAWRENLEYVWTDRQQNQAYSFSPFRRKQYDHILRDWGDKIYPLPLSEDHASNQRTWAELGVRTADTIHTKFDPTQVPAPYGNAVGLQAKAWFHTPSKYQRR